MHKENKNNDFIQQFLIFRISFRRMFMRVSRHMRVHSSAYKQGTEHPGSTSECRLILQLNHWCHMDYFTDVLMIFLGLKCGSYTAVNAG